jgi:SnoaL-like domain
MASPLLCPTQLRWNALPSQGGLMPGDASTADVPTTLAGRVRSALESGDLDAIAELLDPAARWGAPEGPSDADCRNREEVIAWWARARAAGARAMVTEVTVGAGTLLVGLEVTGTPAARESGGAAGRWQVLGLPQQSAWPSSQAG